FRPYHEHTGSWFWWGRPHTSEADYVALWQMTVDHLRRTRGLGHLLFAFSPSGGDVANREQYLYGYPGDEYVDVLGGDYYYLGDSERMVELVELMVELARERGKVPALTEFGARNGINGFMVPSENWLT